MAEATDLFELAWYGDRPTGPAEAARSYLHADVIIAAARAVLP